jgi:hypothetical protein
MEAATRIVLLLAGLGVGEVLAQEPSAEEKGASPIFVVPDAAEPAQAVAHPPERTVVSQQLAALLRYEAGLTPPDGADAIDTAASAPVGDAVQLEKMTVRAKRLMPAPPPRESPLEKFTRTGHLWEFSETKRFMLGPRGDKVGLMFSFDW